MAMQESSSEIEPIFREWTIRSTEDTGKLSITIMTWNVLADGLNGTYGGKSKTFAGVPEEYLVPSHRVPLFIKEIRRWDCDIICLQEFDLYKDDSFMSSMASMGYREGMRQTKYWSPCITIDERLPPDGVAIFYKENLFDVGVTHSTDQLQHKRWIEKELSKLENQDPQSYISTAWIRDRMGESDTPRILDRINAEVNATFRVEEENGEYAWMLDALNRWVQGLRPPVSVGVELIPKSNRDVSLYMMTTHLVATKRQSGEDQRYSELMDLLNDPGHLDRMAQSHSFLCFDMNASYEAINGYIPKAYPLLTGSTPSNANLMDSPPPERTLERFKSATRAYESGDAEMDWTSWKKRKNEEGVEEHSKYGVDFVFYPTSGWNVKKVSGLPSEEDMTQIAAEAELEHFQLPNKKYPSDHLAICVELQMQ